MPVLAGQANSQNQLLHAVERLLELVNADGAAMRKWFAPVLPNGLPRADEHMRALK